MGNYPGLSRLALNGIRSALIRIRERLHTSTHPEEAAIDRQKLE